MCVKQCKNYTQLIMSRTLGWIFMTICDLYKEIRLHGLNILKTLTSVELVVTYINQAEGQPIENTSESWGKKHAKKSQRNQKCLATQVTAAEILHYQLNLVILNSQNLRTCIKYNVLYFDSYFKSISTIFSILSDILTQVAYYKQFVSSNPVAIRLAFGKVWVRVIQVILQLHAQDWTFKTSAFFIILQ